MKSQVCQNCIYAFKPLGKISSTQDRLLICINQTYNPGQLHIVEPENSCRYFQVKKIRIKRQKLPSPQSDEVKFIPLTQGRFAIVDADDYGRLCQYKWYCRSTKNQFYAFRTEAKDILSMHREIMNAPKGLLVDHIDGNGLNNRKSNLRLCTYSQNARNKRPSPNCYSRYKGVTWHRYHNKWYASIHKSGRSTFLGCFDDEIEAALAYDKMAGELFGEFAYLNFPEKIGDSE